MIKVASRIGEFDLIKEFGVDPKVAETLDTTYALAVAAGLQALESAGLIPARAADEAEAPASRKLRHEHRDDTGVIFAASFPALDSLVHELARFMSGKLQHAAAQARGAVRGTSGPPMRCGRLVGSPSAGEEGAAARPAGRHQPVAGAGGADRARRFGASAVAAAAAVGARRLRDE